MKYLLLVFLGLSAEAVISHDYVFSDDKCTFVGKYQKKVYIQRCENKEVICYINTISGSLSCLKK